MILSPLEVEAALQKIRDCGRDYEAAHGIEDDLLWSFVEAVDVMDISEVADILRIAGILRCWRKETADHPRYCA